MTSTPISIACVTSKSTSGAIRPDVPLGTWIAILVDTFPLVCAGMIMSAKLYRSYPAASDVFGLVPYHLGKGVGLGGFLAQWIFGR